MWSNIAWSKIVWFALGASLIPLGAYAQTRDDGGAPPDLRAKFEAARGAAKERAFADLVADHRARVQAIVDAFDAPGSTATVAASASQIDAVLSKDEATAVLAEQKSMREAMRGAPPGGGPADAGPADGGPGGPGGGGPGGPGGPGGGAPGGGPGGPGGSHDLALGSAADGPRSGGRRHIADAGRFLLSVDADPARFREAMRAERPR